jgi:hypothetical protein
MWRPGQLLSHGTGSGSPTGGRSRDGHHGHGNVKRLELRLPILRGVGGAAELSNP